MIRGIGLRSAVAINVAAMVGAGPLITVPLVVASLGGSVSLWPWILGALIAICDGLTYCELGSRFPRSGGTYVYLREAFGARGPGRLAAFLFVWQLLFATPLLLASGYIGFAQYAGYLAPALAGGLPGHALAIGIGVITLLALYRAIPQVAHTGLVLGAIAVGTLAVIAFAGLTHPVHSLVALAAPSFAPRGLTLGALGAALIFTTYDYAGYNDVTQLGDEVIAPVRTIPRSIVLAIAIVGISYVLMNLGIFSVLSPHEAAASTFVASAAIERTLGGGAAFAVTLLILITAFASTYGVLLGTSRVPYAAAIAGDFLPVFGRLHPTKRFPHVALLTFGLLALPASLFDLGTAINVLVASSLLAGSVMTNVAVIACRRTGDAPFRMPFFPLPPLIAIAAWLFLFWSSGTGAMLWGVAMLAAGALVFLVRARRTRAWPFAAAACLLLAASVLPRGADAATFTHARIVQSPSGPQLQVDGKPYFFFGGAFFYDRIPPERWRDSLVAMREAGANTLDLYVPWNWHEVADGRFDFDGHTNPRRNLRRVLALARELGFHLIVRPGPVIRNEWRNGGYPAWLLTRPAYGMPLHDVLEGRYPATATLQNAHSDDAAAQWMRNATHRYYAARWLKHALTEFVPYADLVIAVALDDDQGAYIDNQTWPAPHLHAYLDWLQTQVRAVTGPVVPAFINTYDMKVPASSPVWAMGNWYQSDAYAIGDHDRVELDFAVATLTAQERVPLGASEFQAGWLASPEDPLPRPADPANTLLALAELLSWGAHGVVDFPLQDTLAPFGWEAPFSNAFYSWDAAIPRDPDRLQPHPPARWTPTAHFGAEIARAGPLLAASRRVARIALADEISAADPRTQNNDDVAAIAQTLKDDLRSCNRRGLTCDVVDLRFSSTARMRGYRTLVVPPFVRAPQAAVRARLNALARAGVRIVGRVPNERGSGITVLRGPDATLGIAVNWNGAPQTFGGPTWDGTRTVNVPRYTVGPRDAHVFVLAAPHGIPPAPRLRLPPIAAVHAPSVLLNARQAVHVTLPPAAPGVATATTGAAFGTGERTIALANGKLVALVVPDGGARLAVLALRSDLPYNATNATGALRDDVAIAPPPSPTDRIAAYTHSYPAGTFNRRYDVQIVSARGREAVVRCTYTAPDLGGTVRFTKTFRLAADATRLVVDTSATFAGAPNGQQAVLRSALAVPPAALTETAPTLLAWDGAHAVSVAWLPASIAQASWQRYGSNGTLSLTAAAPALRTTYALARVKSASDARAFAQAERDWLAAHPNPL